MYEFNAADVFDFANSISADTRQKGEELFFKFCPYCGGDGHDKNTFSINLKTGAYKCFRASCDRHGHFVELARDFGFRLPDDETETKYRKLPQKKIETKPKAVEYLKSRGISEATAQKFSITTRRDHDNILVFPFYDDQGEMKFVKYRKTDFDKSKDNAKEWCEKNTMPILFGMNHCTKGGRLVITEGQIDSLSLDTAGIENAVSVPTGAVGFTWLPNCWDWINQFSEIVVFGDYEKGHITLIDTLEKRLRLPVKCVRPEDYLHEKDANDILQKYGPAALVHAVENAELRDTKFVKRLANVKSVNLKDLPKIKTGVRELDRICGGLLLGHVTLLSGKRGEGKSTLMSQIIAEALDQDQAVFAYSGELPDYHFKAWLDMQIAGSKNIEAMPNEYGDSEYYLTEETTEKINKWYYDKAFIFDNSALAEDSDEFKGLIPVVEDAVCRYDIKLVCIDNLMTAMDGDPKSDLYRQQSDFVRKLERLAQKYDVAIILVAHPKKTNQAFDNDTVSGSSDITNAVSFVLNYQRAGEDDECDSKLMLTKNRINGRLLIGDNAIKLCYNQKSKRISEIPAKSREYGPFKETPEQMAKKWEDDLPF